MRLKSGKSPILRRQRCGRCAELACDNTPSESHSVACLTRHLRSCAGMAENGTKCGFSARFCCNFAASCLSRAMRLQERTTPRAAEDAKRRARGHALITKKFTYYELLFNCLNSFGGAIGEGGYHDVHAFKRLE